MNRPQCALDRSVSVVITVATFSSFEKPRVRRRRLDRERIIQDTMLHHHARCLSKCVPIHTDTRKKPSASDRLCNRSRRNGARSHHTHVLTWLTSRCARSATGNAKTRLRATLDFHVFFARLRFPVVARQSTPQSKEGTVSTRRKQVGTHQQSSSSVKYRTIFRR